MRDGSQTVGGRDVYQYQRYAHRCDRFFGGCGWYQTRSRVETNDNANTCG
jgi:hypothetical protein